jgi:hypothetical protein
MKLNNLVLVSVYRGCVWTTKHDETVAARSRWARKSHGLWRKILNSPIDVNEQRHLKCVIIF